MLIGSSMNDHNSVKTSINSIMENAPPSNSGLSTIPVRKDNAIHNNVIRNGGNEYVLGNSFQANHQTSRLRSEPINSKTSSTTT